jgi:hypothetical protein
MGTKKDIRKSRSVSIVAIVAAISLPLLAKDAQAIHGWVRFLVDADQLKGRPGLPFLIASTSYQDYKLSADAWIRYTQGSDPVLLHGKSNPDGLFQPAVTYEAAMEDKTKWKRLPSPEQPKSDTVMVSPEHPILRARIDMEPFRSCIGIYRYGRILLENGDAALIEMEDLLPTADARTDGDGSFREDVSDGDRRMRQQGYQEPAPDAFAHLSSVTSLGGRLIGDFVLVNRSGKSITVSGRRTLDGDFWPEVRYQIGNSLKQWTEVEKSKNNGEPTSFEIPTGKAETVRVNLSGYMPLIGKYKYGKIILSNGEYGVFYTELLDPKS